MDFNDDDGRRYGDWQKKDLRKNANTLQGEDTEKPWYMQNFWIIILLLVFWPVGVYLCWKSDWSRTVKIVATVLVLMLTACGMYVYSQNAGALTQLASEAASYSKSS